jgi:hypothetical protein
LLPLLLALLGRGTQETVGAAETGGGVGSATGLLVGLGLVGTEAMVGEDVGGEVPPDGVGKNVKEVGNKVAAAVQMAGLGSSRFVCYKRFASYKGVR